LVSASAQSYTLLLKSGYRTLPANLEDFVAAPDVQPNELIDGKFYRFVQFYDLPSEAKKASLALMGIELLEYIPRNTFVASIPTSLDMNRLKFQGIRSISPLQSTDKVHESAMTAPYPSWAVQGDSVKLIVKYRQDISPQLAGELFGPWASTSFMDYAPTQLKGIVVDYTEVRNIAELPFVSYVELVPPPDEFENIDSRTTSRGNVLDTDNNAGREYDGTGVGVMIIDGGIVGPHIDFEGRIGSTNTTSGTTSTHEDHVSGTVGGAGNLDPMNRGNAPGVEFHVYRGTSAFNSFPAPYTNQFVRITQTSLGNGCNAGYTSAAQMMDQQVITHTALNHVFSTGNSGTSTCGNLGTGWRTITGGNKSGKGPISVGNMNNDDVINGSSSRGPATDGRLKPDVCNIGTDVTSSYPNNTYNTISGTSMAAPGISGVLAQLYHAYRNLNGGTDPDGALMKAILLNTADDFGNPGPDFTYGWGKANALRAVRVLEDQRYLDSTISQGGTNTHTISVPSGIAKMKVMVYWKDEPASLMASPALVNNLDIGILDPTLTVNQPWNLDAGPNPSIASVTANAGTGQDTLNNMEQVEIDNPLNGAYTLTVVGTDVPMGPQKYYVVIEYIRDIIEVTYPVGGESFAPGDRLRVRWDALGNTGNFTLAYTIDNGLNWTNIGTAPAGDRYRDWTVPTAVSGACRVRVTRGTQADISDANFSIIEVPTNLRITQVCQSSTTLEWDAVTGATSYNVYMLGNKYMDVQGNTPLTSFQIMGTNFMNEHWFSVSANVPANSVVGRRAIAIKSNTGLLNCTAVAPVSGFSTVPLTPCAGTTVTLSDQSQNAPTNWEWIISPATHNFVNATNANSSSPDVQFTALGTYSITLIVSNFAGSDTLIQTVDVQYTSPTVDFDFAPGGLDYIFIDKSSGAFFYNWNFGDGNTSILQNPSHTYAQSGTYTVTLTVSNPCGQVNASKTITVTGTNVDDLLEIWGLQLLPNPNDGHFRLQASRAPQSPFTVDIIDLNGRLIRHKQFQASGGSFMESFDLSGETKGLYFLRVSDGERAANMKLVVK
jgi:PKD repeat protein